MALTQARDDVAQARWSLAEARDAPDPAAAAGSLADAERRLLRAAGRLQQPGPRLAAAVPVLGRSVEAARDTAIAGSVVAEQAGNVLRALPEDLLVGGRVDLDGLARVEQALRVAADRTRRPVQRLVDLELGGTPAALSDGVREVQAELAPVPADLLQNADALAGLQGVLGGNGDRRLLLVLQNNAELRATGGLVPVFAEATARDGGPSAGCCPTPTVTPTTTWPAARGGRRALVERDGSARPHPVGQSGRLGRSVRPDGRRGRRGAAAGMGQPDARPGPDLLEGAGAAAVTQPPVRRRTAANVRRMILRSPHSDQFSM